MIFGSKDDLTPRQLVLLDRLNRRTPRVSLKEFQILTDIISKKQEENKNASNKFNTNH